MILNSDFILYHPLWEKADNFLCNRDAIGLFGRLIDVFIVACSIGIKEDKVLTEIKYPLENPKTIGRNTYMSLQNTDLYDVLSLMLQNAIINSKTLQMDIDERLKLAFDPEYVTKLSPASFLIGFANYGIERIFENINSDSALVVTDELYKYFESLTDSDYEEILNNLTLEVLKEQRNNISS